jgi:hypothetical protein
MPRRDRQAVPFPGSHSTKPKVLKLALKKRIKSSQDNIYRDEVSLYNQTLYACDFKDVNNSLVECQVDILNV